MGINLYLIDGTYELFRHYYGAPKSHGPEGQPVGAVRGLLRSLLPLLQTEETTYIACAFDTQIESFRNELFEGYKDGSGITPDLLSQFEMAERAMHALGVVVWSMIAFEADDALATAAVHYPQQTDIDKVYLCSPDKDLGQCVTGDKVVMLDRRRKIELNEQGVEEKFGVPPASIPDWLALVGDSADGIPGLPRWGAKSSAAVLQRYKKIEFIPASADEWDLKVRGAANLANTLQSRFHEAQLYRTLATLRTDVPLEETIDQLAWQGAHQDKLTAICEEIGYTQFLERITHWHTPA